MAKRNSRYMDTYPQIVLAMEKERERGRDEDGRPVVEERGVVYGKPRLGRNSATVNTQTHTHTLRSTTSSEYWLLVSVGGLTTTGGPEKKKCHSVWICIDLY